MTVGGGREVRPFGQDAVDLAHRWLMAWNTHDAAQVGALCADDVVFTDPMIDTIRGRAAVVTCVEAVLHGFPDILFEEPLPAYVAGVKVIAPWRMTATHLGRMSPPGLRASGRRVTLEGVDHLWIADGRVVRYRTEYDTEEFLTAIGHGPGEPVRVDLPTR